MPFLSPLRYPGGKRRLINFIKTVIKLNGLLKGEYAEPFAGGASVAIALLIDGYVNHIYINDIDRSIYAFWYCVLHKTVEFCELIHEIPINMGEWYKQRKVQANPQTHNLLELGLSTFFLNRTNRSGIITGGVIGGKDQNGDWKLDCRFNKDELISRIENISQHKKQISLYNQDVQIFIKNILPSLSEKSLVYFDPPYYIKGQKSLYLNFYESEDHVSTARLISKLKNRWIISYDNVPEIRTLYKNYESLSYVLHYAAQDKYQGKEILYFCHNLIIPKTENPQFIAIPSLSA